MIIPVKERPQMIVEALDSVLQQDFPHEHLEVLVMVDGGDGPTTAAAQTWASKYGEKLRTTVVSLAFCGVSAARNKGAALAQGQWLAFLDSDDLWLPQKLSWQAELAMNHPECPLVHGEELWRRHGLHLNQHKKHQKSGGSIFLRCLRLCLISPSAALIRRGVFWELGGFDESFHVCEDYDLWLRLTSKYPVAFESRPVLIKRGGHEKQISSSYRAMDFWRVLSLQKFLNSKEQDASQRKAALQELVRKMEILRKGFQKHGHRELEDLMAQWSHRYGTQLDC